jgi:hypothetical protein
MIATMEVERNGVSCRVQMLQQWQIKFSSGTCLKVMSADLLGTISVCEEIDFLNGI